MHIYFSGIGGVGIGPLALLALDMGYKVSGSDMQESELTQILAKRGANITLEQTKTHIKIVHENEPIDWFVHTSALEDTHEELVFVKRHNIKNSKRAVFLNHILEKKDLKLIAVSGTHGKTTTTGMIIWLFQQLAIPVSYSIGTTLSFGPPAQYQKQSKYFVYECDEFDRNFLDFSPHLSVIPSLDYDHPDTYPTVADYRAAFSKFADQSELTVTWESVVELLNTESHLFIVPENQNFDAIQLPGLHNRKNAWLAAVALNRLGLVKNNAQDWNMLLQKISTFPGTMRRFEKLAPQLYTDYAHHPVEIKATIELAQEMNKQVVVVYQPHQNIRQKELLEHGGYGDCFADAKKVYWLPTYLSREDDSTFVTSKEISATAHPATIELAEMNSQLSEKIHQHIENGDLVVGMSAGDLDAWLRAIHSSNS